MKSTWCIGCAHSLVDSPNLGYEIMCEALQRLDMVGKEVVRSICGFAPSRLNCLHNTSQSCQGLGFLNYQSRMKRWKTPEVVGCQNFFWPHCFNAGS